jgi:hypothetical protein
MMIRVENYHSRIEVTRGVRGRGGGVPGGGGTRDVCQAPQEKKIQFTHRSPGQYDYTALTVLIWLSRKMKRGLF